MVAARLPICAGDLDLRLPCRLGLAIFCLGLSVGMSLTYMGWAVMLRTVCSRALDCAQLHTQAWLVPTIALAIGSLCGGVFLFRRHRGVIVATSLFGSILVVFGVYFGFMADSVSQHSLLRVSLSLGGCVVGVYIQSKSEYAYDPFTSEESAEYGGVARNSFVAP